MEGCPIKIIGKCWLVKSVLALSILLKRKLYKNTEYLFFAVLVFLPSKFEIAKSHKT